MTPDKYNFKPRKRGDTFNGISFEISRNDLPVDFTGATAKMQLRRTPLDEVVLEWNSESGSITFLDNVITLGEKNKTQMLIPAAVYLFDLEVTLGNGVTNTYVEGTFEILNDITQ